MIVTQSDLRIFRSLFKIHFGIEISDETARAKLIALVRQLEAVYSPDTLPKPHEEFNEDMNKDNDHVKDRSKIY